MRRKRVGIGQFVHSNDTSRFSSFAAGPACARGFAAHVRHTVGGLFAGNLALASRRDDPEGFASAISNEQEIRLVPVVAAGFKGRRILLADDNADMRSYVERLLSSHGFVVEAVVDGAAALAAARRELPDLILSDVMMPNLDGFGMLREMRADASLRDTPVILLSARAGEEAKIEGLEAGADDYVTKPFSARELVARVSAALNIAHIRRRAEAALHEETRTLETLNRIGTAIASELDLERLVQMVTDASVELTGAQFGAFFYNVIDDKDEHYTLYSISGVERSAFDRFPMPRNTAVFEPTFKGEGIVRSDDILADSPIWQERAVPWDARRPSPCAQLSGCACYVALR